MRSLVENYFKYDVPTQWFGRLNHVFSMLIVLICMFSSIHIRAEEVAVHQFDNVVQEAQYQSLINELRCPKCQNQNLAGSDAPIAVDLRERTFELVKQGQTDAQIRDYMVFRYGDFISYKPPVRPSTWVLWFAPFVLLFLAIGFWVLRMRKSEQIYVHALSDQEAHLLANILNPEKSQHSGTVTDAQSEQSKLG